MISRTGGYSKLKLKEEVLDRAVWRTGFGCGCEPDVRQNTGRKIEYFYTIP